jgi:hypothetical protein
MKTIRSQIFVIVFACCLALSQNSQAVIPPPDGGYPNFTTAEGQNALFNLTTGSANTAVGWFSLFSDTDGSFNTGVGAGTLLFNVGNQTTGEGTQNTAVGTAALLSNTTGFHNTATGVAALLNNTTGNFNIANGDSALRANTTGDFNTATGAFALFSNTTGFRNTANGVQALEKNTTGEKNTAIGFLALDDNTTGSFNTASGYFALVSNTTGYRNTAAGFEALSSNTAGFLNTAIGYQALLDNTEGAGNTALGYSAGKNLTTGDDNICIANDGVAGDAGVIRIGRNFITATYIAGISGQTAPGGAAVFVDADGKLGTSSSSARFKDEIKPMGKASEALFALKPVTFRYKKEIDPQGIPQFGLVAEEVEAVHPDLVVRDKEGKIYSVRYDQVSAMLLNEFLKEHRTVQELKKEIAALASTVKQQAAQIQKVTAQIETSKATSQMVLNGQ